MDDLGPAAGSKVAGREEEWGKLLQFAERIAQAWAEQLEVGPNVVEWVSVKGGCRTPLSATEAKTVVLRLEHEAGIAFVLGCPGMIDVLFVVTHKRTAYSVNISNSSRPWDRSERHEVRPDRVGDLKRLLTAAKKYVRKSLVALPGSLSPGDTSDATSGAQPGLRHPEEGNPV